MRHCPTCHHPLNTARGAALDARELDDPIGAGDVSVCSLCGAILVATFDNFRVAEDADLAHLPANLRRLLDTYARHYRRRHA